MVYEVEHTRTGEHLALKVLLSTVALSPVALERFKREARASARIKSEHVVRVTDADVAPELDGAPFLVMELLEGMDLETAATALRPTPATVVDWLRQVARAIDKAHRIGIVHRDLKPENLFLANVEDRAPMVKVLDFGIAKMAQEGTGATGSGQVLGTPQYMAPEQASGNAPVTSAADLYAMGLIAYRLILGETYYPDDNVMCILGSLLHGHLQPPSTRNPGFGPAFDDWFAKACHKEPEGRFATAVVQIEALAEALGLPTVPIDPAHHQSAPDAPPRIDSVPTVGLGPQSIPVPAPQPVRSRAVVLSLGTVAVVVVVAVAALFIYRGSRTDRRVGAPTIAVPAAPRNTTSDAPAEPKAPSVAHIPPEAPTAVPVAVPSPTRGTGKKSRSAVRGTTVGEGTKPASPADEDPFRDQK